MDFSRPDNARTINRLKVLSALRAAPDTKAGLSRKLGISKVSVGDIVDSLGADGLVDQSGKSAPSGGRVSTVNSIKADAGRVFSIELRAKSLAVAVSDLLGRTLRYERFPKTEGWEDYLCKTLARMKGSEGARIYGGVLVTREEDSVSKLLDFPVITVPPAIVEARSEEARLGDLRNFLFVSWSETFDACFQGMRGLQHLPAFGHIRASRDGLCRCGGTGCLDASASVRFLRERTGESSVRALMKDSPALHGALKALAYALSYAVQTLGAENVIITGDFSAMEDNCYALLQTLLSKALPPKEKEVVVYRALSGDKGIREGAAMLALDTFFYQTALLGQLKAIEDFSIPAP